MANSDSPALEFKVLGKWNKARASVLTLPHHTVKTPVFMPVGTQGSVKGLASKQIQEVRTENEKEEPLLRSIFNIVRM